MGGIPGLTERMKCPAFDGWTRSGSVSSLSIVFATGYLGNPASYYGHTLLKFNFGGDEGQTRLMDVSVNFGAILTKQDGPVTYIVKSLTRGYDAGFSHIHFYFHNHNYGDNELRDLWEYRLDLPHEAVNLIVAHAWEVLGKRYTYDFLKKNCAYRMAEIIEIVDGLKIIQKRSAWIIPQALIEELAVAEYRGRKLLSDVTYLPSRQSRFYARYLNLSAQETDSFRNLVNRREFFDGRQFQALQTSSRQLVLDAILDYYQFVANPLEMAPAETKEEYRKALSARYQEPPGSPELKPRQPRSPHLARPLGWSQVSWRHNTDTGNALSIRLRPAYYDVLDADSGHVRNASLVMGDLQLGLYKNRVRIDKFDLFGVDSANPGLTGLPGDKGTTWKIHVGAEQARLACQDCLVARVQGDYGYGRQWPRGLFGAVYVGSALQNPQAGQGVGYARTSMSFILHQSDQLGMKLGYEQRFPMAGKIGNYGVTSTEMRWAIAPDSDLRLSYEHDRAQQISVGLGIYW